MFQSVALWCFVGALLCLTGCGDGANDGPGSPTPIPPAPRLVQQGSFALAAPDGDSVHFAVAPLPQSSGGLWRPRSTGGAGRTLYGCGSPTDFLARSLGLAGSVRPAFASASPGSTNYAVGGARAYADGNNVNLGDQVQAFLIDARGLARSDALYVIEMASNDIRDAIVAYQVGGSPAAQAVLAKTLTAIAHNMQLLYGAGARHFLVWLPPNVALTPALRYLDRVSPGVATLGTALTQGFNANLDDLLASLSALPDMHIQRLNAYALLNSMVADPPTYHLTNVTAACVTPNVAPFECARPDEYLFWDGIHPARAVHTIVAMAAALLLNA